MQALAFYIILPFILLISVLPMALLYGLSDLLVFPILYYVVGYRKKVSRENLKRSFPEKSEEELLEIERRFYHYLSDLFVETVKTFTISEAELLRRVTCDESVYPLEHYAKENQSFILTLGHYGNYELVLLKLSILFPNLMKVPYKQMSNPHFNSFFKRSRSRFGATMFPTYQTKRYLQENAEKSFILALANDQSAPPPKAFWVKFLNQDTSFFTGSERMAKEYNIPVVFANVLSKGRGVYQMTFEIITEDPSQEPEGNILTQHARLLEKQILDKPEFWLWSHRRWKHKKPTEG